MDGTPEGTPMVPNARTPEGTPDVHVTESDGYVVVKDGETGVTTQGKTKPEALENLVEALRLHRNPIPEGEPEPEPSDAPWF